MSTRAVYTFTGGWIGKVSFYIHFDGYPEGAAKYFYNAIRSEGNLADAFHRANPKAEITSGPEAHGDLEYSYAVEIDETKVSRFSAYKMDYQETDWEWRMFETCGPEAFAHWINRQRTGRDGARPADLVLYVKPHNSRLPGRLTTEEKEMARLASQKAERADYAAKFPHFSGNLATYDHTILGIRSALDLATAEAISALPKEKASV